jgi:alginate O-acetyltransferase complex protein AlgI
MLAGLLVALAAVPVYWLAVPAGRRRAALTIASAVALALVDWRLPLLAGAVLAATVALLPALQPGRGARRPLLIAGLAACAALFAVNKLAGARPTALASQSGLLFLGVSFLTLKVAGALIDAARGGLPRATAGEIAAWLLFLPTYPSGPIEPFDHFRAQQPRYERARVLVGLERILFGLVKALLVAHYLGEWVDPVLAQPHALAPSLVFAALWGNALRIYFDLAGYSDIAIGLSAMYGYEILENFDRPWTQRNLAQFWAHWHMTLTGWLRYYVFTPTSRGLMRRRRGHDRLAIAVGQLTTMLLIGLWHGFGWNFVVFGLAHGIGLVAVTLSRDLGRRLPPALVAWWRRAAAARALGVAITATFFSVSTALFSSDLEHGLRILGALIGR